MRPATAKGAIEIQCGKVDFARSRARTRPRKVVCSHAPESRMNHHRATKRVCGVQTRVWQRRRGVELVS